MAEHDGNILKRHIVGKRDRSPESVTGNMEKKKLYEQQIREESITQFAVCQLISLYSSTWEKSKKVGIIEDVRLPNR